MDALHIKCMDGKQNGVQEVCVVAVLLQLPQERGGSAPNMSVERAKSWLPSMFHRSKHASKQKEVMKKLQDNLRWVPRDFVVRGMVGADSCHTYCLLGCFRFWVHWYHLQPCTWLLSFSYSVNLKSVGSRE